MPIFYEVILCFPSISVGYASVTEWHLNISMTLHRESQEVVAHSNPL